MAGYIGSKAVNLSTTGADINGDANIDGDLSFRDNDKAIFGAGSDLQIYHDGSSGHSIITESGGGALQLQGENLVLEKPDGTNYLLAVSGASGYVKLYQNGSQKLATTSTGVDITGTLTSDGLTVDGDAKISATSPTLRITETDTTDVNTRITAGSGNLYIQTENDAENSRTDRLRIEHSTGDISFYEDTGSTPKLFWDASAESLGIGTSSPSKKAHLYASNDSASLRLENTANSKVWDITPARPGVANTGLSIHNVTDDRIDLHVDNSGNVGIGTSSPSAPLQVEGTTNGLQSVFGLDSSGLKISTFQKTGNDAGVILDAQESSNGTLTFATTGSERMRLDASGRLLVGKTAQGLGTAGFEVEQAGQASFTQSGASCVRLNRLSSDGDIIQLRKDTSQVGSIGSNSGYLYIGSFQGNDAFLLFGADIVSPATSTGANRDNAIDLGHSSARFDDVYATNGTIQTSDRNEKQDIAELTDAEQRVAVAAKGLLRKFRWRDAVTERGDEARTHFGIIAQDLQAAFAAEGLDAGDYAMFISSTWTDEETGEERTRMGVRYSELLAFIIGAL